MNKKADIKDRLNALFQWEWIVMNIPKDREATAHELTKAMDWAHELSEQVIKDFKQMNKSEVKYSIDNDPLKCIKCNGSGLLEGYCSQYTIKKLNSDKSYIRCDRCNGKGIMNT